MIYSWCASVKQRYASDAATIMHEWSAFKVVVSCCYCYNLMLEMYNAAAIRSFINGCVME